MSRTMTAAVLAFVCAIGAGSSARAAGVYYRLTAGAGYTEGCFAPCMCPIFFAEPIRGVLKLTPSPSPSPSEEHYAVSDLFFVVGTDSPSGLAQFRVAGAGEYVVTHDPSTSTSTQRMTLLLSGRDGELKRFDSGEIALAPAQRGLNLTVSMNGMFCYDIAIAIVAAPVSSRELRPYRLVRGSTFQQGCFNFCDCLLELQRTLSGRFALIPLGSNGSFDEFAVVDAQFAALRPAPSPADFAPLAITGAGFYRVGGLGPAPQQQLLLELAVGADPPRKFDSGLVIGGEIFPAIDATVTMNNLNCYDRVLHIIARPQPQFALPAFLAPTDGAGAIRIGE